MKLYYDTVPKGCLAMVGYINGKHYPANELAYTGERLLHDFKAGKNFTPKADAVLVIHRGYEPTRTNPDLPSRFILAITWIQVISDLNKEHKNEPPAWLHEAFYHNQLVHPTMAQWEEWLMTGWTIERKVDPSLPLDEQLKQATLRAVAANKRVHALRKQIEDRYRRERAEA